MAPKSYNQDSQYPTALRWRGSIVLKVVPDVLVAVIYTTVIVVIYNFVPGAKVIAVGNALTSIVSFVVSLLLVFRTAYDRYWEGRRMFSNMSIALRGLNRVAWVQFPNPVSREERVNFSKLLIGFQLAVRHYLRNGLTSLKPLDEAMILCLPKVAYKIVVNPSNALPVPAELASYVHEQNEHIPNIPLRVIQLIASYMQRKRDDNFIDVSTFSTCMNLIGALTDSLSNLERIASSPIPLAYLIHLRHVLIIYVYTLPFQIVGTMNWATILTIFFASFIIFGIECIATEIAMPFGLDANDLDQEKFCGTLLSEFQTTALDDIIPKDFAFEYARLKGAESPAAQPIDAIPDDDKFELSMASDESLGMQPLRVITGSESVKLRLSMVS